MQHWENMEKLQEFNNKSSLVTEFGFWEKVRNNCSYFLKDTLVWYDSQRMIIL